MDASYDQAASVLILGESVMDILVHEGTETHRPGGSPMNVAVGMGRLGHPVELLTELGPDAAGEAITDHLCRAGVTVLGVSHTSEPTSIARAVLQKDGSAEYDFDIRWKLPRVNIEPRRVVHTGSIGAILEPGAREVRRLIDQQPDALISYDPNIRPAIMGNRDHVRQVVEGLSAQAHVVKMSDEDATWLYPGASPAEVAAALIAAGVKLAAITLGPDGCIVRTPTATLTLPAYVTSVVDTIGAGDAFMAGMLDAIVRLDVIDSLRSGAISNEQARQIAERGLSAAAITVSRQGAQPPTAEEMSAYTASVQKCDRQPAAI